jgi:hypothetical protein
LILEENIALYDGLNAFILLLGRQQHRDYELASTFDILAKSIEYQAWVLEGISMMESRRFKEKLKVSTSTFVYTCDLLREDLRTNLLAGLETLPNKHLSVKRQIAIALRRFAGGDSYATLEACLVVLSQQFQGLFESLCEH